MDNKLSELSKPVAYDYQIASACIADGNDKKWVGWNNKFSRYCPPDWMVEEGKVTELKPLYSQEYVSALLAELEAKDEQNKLLMREIEHGKKLRVNMQNNADSLSERIAELEEDRRQLNLIINSEANRADAAEKRVAELSELETHNECLIKKNADLTQQNIKLGERLATPVRLPNKNDDEFWFDGVFQVAKFDRAVERAISAVGFKFAWDE